VISVIPTKASTSSRSPPPLPTSGSSTTKRVHITGLRDGVVTEWRLSRPNQGQPDDGFIDRLKPEGPSHFTAACNRFRLCQPRTRAYCWCSPISSSRKVENGLSYIAGGSIDLFAVRSFPPEIRPDLQGDLKLGHGRRDMAEVSITALIKSTKKTERGIASASKTTDPAAAAEYYSHRPPSLRHLGC